MQILPREESFGGALGSGLGQLAGLKLAQLVKRHEQQQERSQFAKSWEPILGKQSAHFLSNLGPQERQNAMQNIDSLLQLNEPASSSEQVRGMQSLGSAQQQQQPQGMQQFDRDYFIKKALGHPETQQESLLSGLQGMQPQQYQQPQEQQTQGQPQVTPDKAKLIADLFATPQEKAAREKLEAQKRQEEFKEKQFNIKETKKYVDSLKDKEKAAKESELRLKRMKTLIEKGNLPNAGLWSFLSKIEDAGPLASGAAGALLGHVVPGVGNVVGGIAGALSSPLAGAVKSLIKTGSPDIEEFEKLSTDFVKNAKQYFGSRITEGEIKIFMRTLPTLMQTDAGKLKVIENLSAINELAEIEAKAARSIIRDNRGIPPIDIEEQVENKISHKIDKVAKKFIEQ